MPFTPTHILGVLPLHFYLRKLQFAPLAIGSMIPDFVMFFPISNYSYSHSLIGLVGYCVPVGMVVYYLWELFGKMFAIDLSPTWVKYRMDDYRNAKPNYGFVDLLFIAIAIIFGSITHIVWDAFTHKGEWGIELIPLLANKIEIASFAVPGYKLFQYGSTFIGLPLLAVWGFFYLRSIKGDRSNKSYSFKPAWIYAIASSFVVVLFAVALSNYFQVNSFKSIIGNTIKQSLGGGIGLFFFYAIIYKIQIQRNLRQ